MLQEITIDSNTRSTREIQCSHIACKKQGAVCVR